MKHFFAFCSFLIAVIASAEPTIEILAELNYQRPGNPAVGPDGTVYFSMHPFDEPKHKVMQLHEDGSFSPFPTEWISKNFAAVIGIQTDSEGRVWILDMGSETTSPKLLAWDTKSNSLFKMIYLPKEVLVPNSFVQDFAVDEKHDKIYIADMSRSGMIDASEPAIIVVDLETGYSKRLLQSFSAFQPKLGEVMITEGTPATFTDEEGTHHPLEIGLNPIAIDAQNEWVYFSTIHPGSLYRVPAAKLANMRLRMKPLIDSIELFAPKPTSDGIAADGKGRVFITNLEDNAISIADESGTRIWVQDDRFVWPDGVYVAPDGSVVATINQLNRAAPFNKGVDGSEPPYYLVRISE
ncbi:MAG: L-dopachrome tautomerase-related protein [Verrucomicrobiota bacterium]